MAEVLWPLVTRSAHTWRLIPNSALVARSPLNGSEQTISRPGARWGVTIQYDNLRDDDRTEIMSALAELDGYAGRIRIYDSTREAPASGWVLELFQDPENPVAWTPHSDTELVKRGPYLLARHKVGSVTSSVRIRQRIDNRPGFAYGRAYRISGFFRKERLLSGTVRVGSSPGQDDILVATPLQNFLDGHDEGTFTHTFNAPPSGQVWVEFRGEGGGTKQEGCYWARLSCALTCRVNGPDQSGNRLIVDGLPPSFPHVFTAGDYFGLSGATYMVTHTCDSDEDGNALLRFVPALRNVPGDNAPLNLYRPRITCRLATPEYVRTDSPGLFSSMTLDLIETIP